MTVRDAFQIPEERQAALRRARRLEWTTIAFMVSIIVVMGLAMGTSQAMKAAWVEDLLSVVPALSFLVAGRVRDRAPNGMFPYGYRRVDGIAFLVASTALLLFGGVIFFDSALRLVMRERPSIGLVHVFGHDVWSGWVMIAALVYSIVPPLVLGRLKTGVAHELHDKTIYTDAQMNKADWLTGVAGILGILGLAIGWWWADATAALVISLDIVHDGYKNLRSSVEHLMDRRPLTVDRTREHPLPDRAREALVALPWVADAQVRLREEGHVFTGEVFVVPRDRERLLERLEEARGLVERLDWRVHEVVVVPVRALRTG